MRRAYDVTRLAVNSLGSPPSRWEVNLISAPDDLALVEDLDLLTLEAPDDGEGDVIALGRAVLDPDVGAAHHPRGGAGQRLAIDLEGEGLLTHLSVAPGHLCRPLAGDVGCIQGRDRYREQHREHRKS